jgi:hypothetical protein
MMITGGGGGFMRSTFNLLNNRKFNNKFFIEKGPHKKWAGQKKGG